jgi:hypothetical protein
MSETSAPPPRLTTGPMSLPPDPMQSASADRHTVLLAHMDPASLEDDDESRP